MAGSRGFAASISLPCIEQRSYGVPVATASVLDLQRKTHIFKIPFLAEKRLHASRRSVLVSCLGDHNTSPVTAKSWEKHVIGSKSPVLVEFYAAWCGPCCIVHRLIDEIATEYSGRLNCFVIDADRDSQLAKHYDVKAVPMVLLFKDGKKRDSILGTMPKSFYLDVIERILAS